MLYYCVALKKVRRLNPGLWQRVLGRVSGEHIFLSTEFGKDACISEGLRQGGALGSLRLGFFRPRARMASKRARTFKKNQQRVTRQVT